MMGTGSKYKEDKSLNSAIKDAMSWSVMIGYGETYLSAFAVFLLGTPFQISMVSTLPPLFGALAQWVGVQVMDRLQGRRTFIVISAVLQALIWFPIAAIPFLCLPGAESITALLVLVTLYHVFGNSGNPAWNSLIGDIVPVEGRGEYFGYRNKQAGWVTFASLFTAGAILRAFQVIEADIWGFFTLFVIAGAARVLSAWYLTQYSNPPFKITHSDKFTFLQFIRAAPRSNFGTFVLFFASMNFSASLVGPLVSVYLLRDVQFHYLEYTAVVSAQLLTQFMTMHYWGSLSDRFGNKKVLNVCSVGLAIIPFCYLISSNFFYMIAFHMYAGCVWAGFLLGASNFLFDAVSPPKRARCVAYQQIVSAFFVLCGGLLGGVLVTAIPNNWILGSGLFTVESSTLRIFFLSGCFRSLVCIYFLPRFKEVREVEPVRHRDLVFRFTGVRSSSGLSIGAVTPDEPE